MLLFYLRVFKNGVITSWVRFLVFCILLLQLLCQFERNSVLRFLGTFDSYRVEHCLRKCQEYGIIDAAAFLLERVGDAGSALLLTLSGLNDNFPELESAVESVVSDMSVSASSDHYSTVLKLKEVDRFMEFYDMVLIFFS